MRGTIDREIKTSESKIEIHDENNLKEIENALELLLYVPEPQLKSIIIKKFITYYNDIIKDDIYKIKIFIAYRENIICGFVSSLIHPTYRSYGKKCGTFGWLNCINDFDVCRKLLESCENFIRKNNIRKIRGNINFPKGLGGLGIQTEGFHENMLYGVAFNNSKSNIPNYLEKLGYKPESEYICMEVTQKIWDSSDKLDNDINLGYLTIEEFCNRKEEIHELARNSFQGSFPVPDASGRYRLEEVIKSYIDISKSNIFIKDNNYDIETYKKIKYYKEAWEKCELEKALIFAPLAFEKKTDKIVGIILGIPNLYEYYLHHPIKQVNVDTVMVDKNYTGKGIFSALNNLGQKTCGIFGMNYFEGTSIWNKNPDAIKAIFPHGKPKRKHIIYQKRIRLDK